MKPISEKNYAEFKALSFFYFPNDLNYLHFITKITKIKLRSNNSRL